jgi:hypothetical protein
MMDNSDIYEDINPIISYPNKKKEGVKNMNKTGIIKAKEEKVKQDGDIFYKYKVEIDGKELTMSDFSGFNLELNKTYDIDWTEKEGEYNGSPITYRNITLATLSGVQKPVVTPANNYKPNQPDKDTKIGRMAALNTATEIVSIVYKNKLAENKDLIVSEIIDLAEKLEQWVNR